MASTHPMATGWNLEYSYARLPEHFYTWVRPTPVRMPELVMLNTPLAETLGLNATWLQTPVAAAIFAGNQLPEGATPMAQAYAGHQFGYFTRLGDGRAILLGEQMTPQGHRYDVQLKGGGQTPYSRRGDGRAALGPMLREYLISEAMHALRIPTTRSLAVMTTGESVFRETTLPGAVLTRVAASHIRVGTFEYAAAWGTPEDVKALADYALQRHNPSRLEADKPYWALLQGVMERQAQLIAQWQLVGFIHGVMNTDNMAISGETIDYGPCAFMDVYHPATVFSSIDAQGRYAYQNQPRMGQWNLARFAETLLPLLHTDSAKAVELAQTTLEAFTDHFETCWLAGMRAKLGLFTLEPEDHGLIEALLRWMQQHQADYTNTFRALSSETLRNEAWCQQADFVAWYHRWQARLARQPQSWEQVLQQLQRYNPQVIPRNHRVEAALKAAETGDLSVLKNLLAVLATPFAPLLPEQWHYGEPPAERDPSYQTFCGT